MASRNISAILTVASAVPIIPASCGVGHDGTLLLRALNQGLRDKPQI